MTKQYYYQFSQESYSDYGVGGLYLCDHEVTEAELEEHYVAYQEECYRLNRLIPQVQEAWGMANDWESEEYKTYKKFYEDNTPESSFAKLHNMVELECKEFWRDC